MTREGTSEETPSPDPSPVLIRPEDLEDNGRRYAGTLALADLSRPGDAPLQVGPVAFGV